MLAIIDKGEKKAKAKTKNDKVRREQTLKLKIIKDENKIC